jgi:hypothetical protein
MIYTTIDVSHTKRNHRQIRYRDYKKFNEDKFKQDICVTFSELNVQLKQIFEFDLTEYELEKSWLKWKEAFLDISNKYAPYKTRRLRNRRSPWINSEIVKLMYRRDYLHKKAKSSKDHADSNKYWLEYKSMRNYITSKIRLAKQNHYIEISNKYEHKPKNLWNEIKNVMPKQTNDVLNDISANTFNDYFASIGEKVASKIDKTKTPKMSFPNSIYTFSYTNIVENDIVNILNKLGTNSKNDVLDCDSKLLNITSHLLAPSLTLLFNASLKIGYIPKDWKLARVTPAFKGKGDYNDKNNYRPLSVISHIAKALEYCVHKQLLTYLITNKFITKDQFAYLKNNNAQLCLHRLVDDILENLNFKEKTGMCFLDIRKCFDSIDHDILIAKLEKYGILNKELNWFRSYLKCRSQVVCHNGVLSDSKQLNIGVPQGTILGPILFLIYVNDLPNAVTNNAQINIFADDVVVYSNHDSLKTLNENLQNTMNNVFDWYETNRLSLSLEKCKSMVINNNLTHKLDNFSLELGDTKLDQVSQMKYLGVTIDDELNWQGHLKNIAMKINATNARLRRLRKILPIDIRIKIHKAINIPILDYASTVWGQFSKTTTDFINKLEHRCARTIIGNYDYINTRGSEIMTDLGITHFDDRLKYQKSLLMFKAIHGLAPDFLLNYITFNFELNECNLRSSDSMNLYLPKPNSELFRKSLLYSGPKQWNALPDVLKSAESVYCFKKLYKNHFT